MQVTLTLQNIFPSNFAMVFWIIIPNKNTDNTSCIGNLLKILIVDSWPFARLYLLKNHELGILTLLNKEKIPSAMWTNFKICSLCNKKKSLKELNFIFTFLCIEKIQWKQYIDIMLLYTPGFLSSRLSKDCTSSIHPEVKTKLCHIQYNSKSQQIPLGSIELDFS